MTDQSILLSGSQLFGANCSAIAQLADYGYVVEIPRDTPFGVRIRWVATPYSDESPDGIGIVQSGDIGAFLGFDGPESNEAILSFPAVGTFVFDAHAVEVAE
jgi:hypothetical protein